MRTGLATLILIAAMTYGSSESGLTQYEDKSVPGVVSGSTIPQNGISVPACPAKFEFHQDLDGIYKVGGDVNAPKPKRTKDPSFSDEARRLMRDQHLSNFHAVSTIGFTVSAKGKTQDLCVIKAAGYGLDEKALQAVAKWRFEPAKKGGTPVAVRISTEVDFKAY